MKFYELYDQQISKTFKWDFVTCYDDYLFSVIKATLPY